MIAWEVRECALLDLQTLLADMTSQGWHIKKMFRWENSFVVVDWRLEPIGDAP